MKIFDMMNYMSISMNMKYTKIHPFYDKHDFPEIIRNYFEKLRKTLLV